MAVRTVLLFIHRRNSVVMTGNRDDNGHHKTIHGIICNLRLFTSTTTISAMLREPMAKAGGLCYAVGYAMPWAMLWPMPMAMAMPMPMAMSMAMSMAMPIVMHGLDAASAEWRLHLLLSFADNWLRRSVKPRDLNVAKSIDRRNTK